jgi:hypothetical protein
MNYPLLAFSARPDLVPDGAPRSLPTGLRMSQAGDQPVRCGGAPDCNPGTALRLVADSPDIFLSDCLEIVTSSSN